jgi:hypothetical protein
MTSWRELLGRADLARRRTGGRDRIIQYGTVRIKIGYCRQKEHGKVLRRYFVEGGLGERLGERLGEGWLNGKSMARRGMSLFHIIGAASVLAPWEHGGSGSVDRKKKGACSSCRSDKSVADLACWP